MSISYAYETDDFLLKSSLETWTSVWRVWLWIDGIDEAIDQNFLTTWRVFQKFKTVLAFLYWVTQFSIFVSIAQIGEILAKCGDFLCLSALKKSRRTITLYWECFVYKLENSVTRLIKINQCRNRRFPETIAGKQIAHIRSTLTEL